MAILFHEHFDGYTNTAGYHNAVAVVSAQCTYVASGGRFGGGCVQAGSLNTGDIRLLKASPGSNMIRAMFHFKSTESGSSTGTRPILRFTNAAGDRFWNMFMIGAAPANGIIRVSRFDDTGTATTAFNTDLSQRVNDGYWHHIEVELSASLTVGSLKVWIDGVLAAESITSGDTSDAASGDVTTFDRVVYCGCSNNSGGATQVFMDDLIVWDDTGTDFTGAFASNLAHRSRKFSPTADGAQGVAWTPLAGANWQNVDEAAYDSDTSYNSETTLADKDFYICSSLGVTLTTIIAAWVENIAKIDTGTHTIRNLLRPGSTTYNGVTSAALTTTYVKRDDYYGENPDTTNPWTQSEIEATQFGVEMVS